VALACYYLERCGSCGAGNLPWSPLWDAFQAALSGHTSVFDARKCRLKAGCSQDWLPHHFRGNALRHLTSVMPAA
jgi:hypothetical protein